MVKQLYFIFISFFIYASHFSCINAVDVIQHDITSHDQFEDNLLPQDILEESYNQLAQFLEVIDNALEHLALVTNNNQIRGLTAKQDKQKAIQRIFEVRKYIDLKKKPIMQVTIQDYATLSKTILVLVKHVHEMIAKGLKDIPSFVEPMITRSETIDLEQIQKDVLQATRLVNTLEQKANNVGLSKLNRAFRKLESWDHKYKLRRKFLWALGITVAASYILYRLSPSYFEKKVNDNDTIENGPNYLNGQDPNKMSYDEVIDAKARIELAELLRKQHGAAHNKESVSFIKKWLGDPYDPTATGAWNKVEELLTVRLGLITFFSGTVTWFALPEYLKDPTIGWLKERWDWAKKRLGIIASYLRGGPVKKMLSEFEQEPKATFEDVIGTDEVKKLLLPVIDYIVNYKNRDRSGIIPSTGILFIGAPRTGKSFMAEALAGEIKRMSPEQIRLLGFTAAELKEFGITKLFGIIQEAAQETGPMIVVIDEIDTIGLKRPGTGAKDNPVLCEFLTVLSSLNRQKTNKIVVIACTNKPQDLDDALKEPGRFGIHVHFKYPTEEERKDFLVRELTNRTIYIEQPFIDQLAHMTEGCSFDALNQLLTSALQQAKIEERVLTQADLEQSYYQHINRIVFTDNTMPDTEQQIIALYQAGEVLARTILNTKKQVSIATTYAVNPNITHDSLTDANPHNLKQDRTMHGKVFTIIDKNSVTGQFKGALNEISLPKFFTHSDYIDEIKTLLAGAASESLVNNSTSYIYQQPNREKALEIAKYITLNGIPNADYPQQYKEQKFAEALTIIDECEKEVTQLLSTRVDELVTLANALHMNKLLTAAQMQEVLEQSKNNQPQDDISVDDLLAEEPKIATNQPNEVKYEN